MAKDKRVEVRMELTKTKAQRNQQRREFRERIEQYDFDHEVKEVFDNWPTVKVDVIKFK